MGMTKHVDVPNDVHLWHLLLTLFPIITFATHTRVWCNTLLLGRGLFYTSRYNFLSGGKTCSSLG